MEFLLILHRGEKHVTLGASLDESNRSSTLSTIRPKLLNGSLPDGYRFVKLGTSSIEETIPEVEESKMLLSNALSKDGEIEELHMRLPDGASTRPRNSGDNVTRQGEASELASQEDKAKRRAEQRDERLRLLAQVKAQLPDLTAPVGEKMMPTKLRDEPLLSKEDTRLLGDTAPKSTHIDATDFYTLPYEGRADLLDRIGFFRGLVFSSRPDKGIQQGFWDVLRRRPADESGDPYPEARRYTTQDARVLYRTPKLSGYFQSSFTSSRTVHQFQKDGVQNLKVGGSVAVSGAGWHAAVGAEYGQHKASKDSGAGSSNNIYLTNSFLIPKIELSFNQFTPCASPEFIAAVAQAIEARKGESLDRRFKNLLVVLENFGHFVATKVVVGGRLLATKTESSTSSETASDKSEKQAAALKAAVSGTFVDAELHAEGDKGKREQKMKDTLQKAQALDITSIGGDGSFLEAPWRWAETLENYRYWNVVSTDGLIPSLDVLPDQLRLDAYKVLRHGVQDKSLKHILDAGNAEFLFFGEYYDRVGAHVNALYIIQSAESDLGIARGRPTATPVDGEPVGLAKVSGWVDNRDVSAKSSVWRLTPDGHIISVITNDAVFSGEKPAEFAIAVELVSSLDGADTAIIAAAAEILKALQEGKPAKIAAAVKSNSSKAFKVILKQFQQVPEQVWEVDGSGHLINHAFCTPLYLTSKKGGTLTLETDCTDNGEDSCQLWTFKLELESVLEKQKQELKADDICVIRDSETQLVLTADEVKDWAKSKTYWTTLHLSPYLGRETQLWKLIPAVSDPLHMRFALENIHFSKADSNDSHKSLLWRGPDSGRALVGSSSVPNSIDDQCPLVLISDAEAKACQTGLNCGSDFCISVAPINPDAAALPGLKQFQGLDVSCRKNDRSWNVSKSWILEKPSNTPVLSEISDFGQPSPNTICKVQLNPLKITGALRGLQLGLQTDGTLFLKVLDKNGKWANGVETASHYTPTGRHDSANPFNHKNDTNAKINAHLLHFPLPNPLHDTDQRVHEIGFVLIGDNSSGRVPLFGFRAETNGGTCVNIRTDALSNVDTHELHGKKVALKEFIAKDNQTIVAVGLQVKDGILGLRILVRIDPEAPKTKSASS